MIELRTLGTPELYDAGGAPVTSLLAQRKRLALLVYLAVATPRGCHSRDTLLALLWPELDAERGRSALRQALHFVRRELGADAVVGRGEEGVGIDASRVRVDVREFEDLIAAERFGEALAQYRGDLLPAFYVAEAPEFERWLESRRQQLRRQAIDAARAASRRHESGGDAAGAVFYARRAIELAGVDEIVLREALELHDRLDDLPGALQLFAEYARRAGDEYGISPSSRTLALVDAIRRRAGTAVEPASAGASPAEPAGAAEAAAPEAVVDEAAATPAVLRPRRSRRLRVAALAAVALVVGTWGAYGLSLLASPTLAVGHIADLSPGTAADSSLGAAVTDLLATNLGRSPEVSVVSTPRMVEVLAQTGGSGGVTRDVAAAARRAGASYILDGDVRRLQDGTLRLDLRRRRLSDGSVQQSWSVEAFDVFTLVERATSQVLRGRTAGSGLADVTTRSLAALGLYRNGLRLYYAGDPLAAMKFFEAALREDPNFAMAAYYLALSNHRDWLEQRAQYAQAVRLAARAPERERLLIQAAWADATADTAHLTLARRLARRFPAEPDGQYQLGKALLWHGDFLAAVPYLEAVVRMDAPALRRQGVRCLACDAIHSIGVAYAHADSLPAAERAMQRFAAGLQPGEPGWRSAMDMLAIVLELGGRITEAIAIREALGQFEAPTFTLHPALLALRQGEHAAADRLLRLRVHDHDRAVRRSALWYLAISLRDQGRYREAVEAAREMAALETNDALAPAGYGLLAEAIVLFEMRRHREAAALLRQRAAAVQAREETVGWIARNTAWNVTHEAVALAAAGDTATVRILADSVQRVSRGSSYGRDPRLHHHLRGLLHVAAGRPAAAEAEFRRAVYSWTSGYTRTNVELARLLTAQDRPLEAVAVLEPALRGSIEASNLYVPRTEIRELLGRAWDAAGRPEQALPYYEQVLRAWSAADPELHERRADLRRRADAARRAAATTRPPAPAASRSAGGAASP